MEENMVLNDLVLEYKSINEIIGNISTFVTQAENLVSSYSKQIKTATTLYFNSKSSSPSADFTANINKCMATLNSDILRLNSQTRDLYKCIALIENHIISNEVLSDECKSFIEAANNSVDITFKIIEAQFENAKKEGLYNELLDSLNEFLTHYRHISLLYEHVAYIESVLYEPLPTGVVEDEVSTLEIKSNKICSDFNTYSEDIQTLSKFIMQLEMIMAPGTPHAIFTRRIESGSLRIVWGSNTIELSCISDVISGIIDAIKTFAFLPYEMKLKKLEVESKKIDIESSREKLNAKKLSIINSNIDNIIDKLGLDKSNPEDIEKIQLLCLPLIDYLNSNPIGSINGVTYDLTNEILLLENKTK